jgi:hypothetical protein
MKKLCALGALITAAASSSPALATDVGVSINISQPGVYGRVDIGRFPQPQVVVAQPIIIQQRPVTVVQPVQPVYMWVPPGHRQDWRRHCGAYNACGVPVYFVQDEWYERQVRPHGHAYGHDKDKPKGKDKHKDKHQDKGHDDKGKHGN